MKKLMSLVCAAALVTLCASAASALQDPGTGVYQSVHDLTNGPGGAGAPLTVPGFVTDPQQRLCAYCHTPHHAIAAGDAKANGADFLPLWSHDVSAVNYTPYISATFSPKGGNSMASDPLTGPSRLCMSCHDGITAVDNYYGLTNNHAMVNNAGAPFTGQPVISGNGETNHPLGFAMTDVIPGYAGATNPDTNSVLALTATSKYVSGLTDSVNVVDRLYGGAIMTCSSCHDVHNTLNKVSFQAGAGNFLLLGTQKNSGICLSCHTQGGGDTGVAHTTVPAAAFLY
jgi:hypothetical protein